MATRPRARRARAAGGKADTSKAKVTAAPPEPDLDALDGEALRRRWEESPSREVAEALARRAHDQIEQGRTLTAWLDALDDSGDAPEASPDAALMSFGAAALPGLCLLAEKGSPRASSLLARLAPQVAFVGKTLLARYLDRWRERDRELLDAVVACVHAGGIAREQLVLTPGLRYKWGSLTNQLGGLLVRLGPAYAGEMLLFVERTVGLCHQTLVDSMDSQYRPHNLPPPDEYLPVLDAILRSDQSFGQAEAAWFALQYGPRAAPLCDALIATLKNRDEKARRGAAATLAKIRAPAAIALAPLVALLEQGLATRDALRRPWDVVEAIGCLEPPPVHLVPRLEAALLLAAEERLGFTEVVARAISRITPERIVPLLEAIATVDADREGALAIALLKTTVVSESLRTAWLIRMLDSPQWWRALELAAKHPSPELVPHLCTYLRAETVRNDRLLTALAHQDHALVIAELEPRITASDARLRHRALQVAIRIEHGPTIARFVSDDDPSCVHEAAYWLAAHGTLELLPQIVRLIGHRKKSLRCLALRGIRCAGVASLLEEVAAGDRSPRVKRLARALRDELRV